eukprot:scaffold7065_cov54-Phaeocystis_antarctica.AAC.3
MAWYRLLLETKLAAITGRDVARATRAHVRACSVATCTDAVVVVDIEDSDDLDGDAPSPRPLSTAAVSTSTTAVTADAVAVAADADEAAASARGGVEAQLPHGGRPADASLTEDQLRTE